MSGPDPRVQEPASARPTLRVFVSSPGDVGQEREIARRVLERLAAEFEEEAIIEPVLWEQEPLRATATFQTQLRRPSETDIVITILWSRLGTRLPAEIRREDGSRYASGTEFEMEDAVASYRARGVPDLLVYRKTAEPLVSLKNRSAARARLDQAEALDRFLERWFHGADGSLLAAFHPFADPFEFEQLLERHLGRLIEERLLQAGVTSPARRLPATWVEGSPFRGLEVFEPEHAPVFFGRTRATAAVVEQLQRQAAAGRAFVLVLGPSGSGKSSLARAGVLPLVTRPGVIEGAEVWRRAVLRPSDGDGGLLESLVAALCRERALPELLTDSTRSALAQELRDDPKGAHLLVNRALREVSARAPRTADLTARPAAGKPPACRLLLLVDQLEETLSLTRFSDSQREAFLTALTALASSGRTFVVATLRSDFFPSATKLPGLLELMAGDGTYHLLPPAPYEIGSIVERPARAAGLRFEEDPVRGPLSAVLRDAAAASPESLPLLEFTLEELYRARTGDGRLTFAAYDELGGLDGAIERRAEAAFSAAAPATRACLPSVFRALVTVDESREDRPFVRRQASLGPLRRDPAQAELVRALTDARLLVVDRAGDGAAVVTIAHEALLRAWPRLSRQLERDRDLLRARRRLSDACARWLEAGRPPDLLLPAGSALGEALRLRDEPGFLLGEDERRLVARSAQEATRSSRRKRAAVFALILLTIVALAGALVAWTAQRHAVRSARAATSAQRTAEAKSALALVSRREAVQAQAQVKKQLAQVFLAKADLALSEGRTFDAQAYSAEGLTLADLPALRGRLARAQRGGALRWTTPLQPAAVTAMMWLPGGRRLTTISGRATARFWDASSGKPVPRSLPNDEGRILGWSSSPDGTRAMTAPDRKTLRVWDEQAGRLIATLTSQEALRGVVGWSPDGSRIATMSSGQTVRIWAAATGHAVTAFTLPAGRLLDVAWSPDSTRLATVSEGITARLWDTSTGKAVLTLAGHEDHVYAVAWSPDSTRLATASQDNTARVWNASTGRTVLILAGHKDGVFRVAWSPDGDYLATGSVDGTARVWSAKTGRSIAVLPGYEVVQGELAWSPDSASIATIWRKTAVRVWSASTGQARTTLRHRGKIAQIAWSPVSGYLATASEDRTARVWDLRGGETVVHVSGKRDALDVTWSPDGRRVATAGEHDGPTRVRDAFTGRLLATLTDHEAATGELKAAWSPDGTRLATASGDGTTRVWDASTGRRLSTMPTQQVGTFVLAWSPSGTRLATASFDNAARLWEADTGKLLATLAGHRRPVLSVAWSPDGARIATACYDQTARIWDASTGQIVFVLPKHDRPVVSLAWAPDSSRLVSIGDSRGPRVWDASTGQLAATLSVQDRLWDLAWSPDSSHLAIADSAGVQVWARSTGQLSRLISGVREVEAVAWSPNGARLATVSNDKVVQIWDGSTGLLLATLTVPMDQLSSLEWWPRGIRLASLSDDSTRWVRWLDLHALDAFPADLLQEAKRRTGLRVEGLQLVDISQEVAVYPANGLTAERDGAASEDGEKTPASARPSSERRAPPSNAAPARDR